MTPLARLIAEDIAQTGPITLAQYMSLCLQHPEYGYYTTRDPLGSDFTTAPEISQMFGELIGLCMAQCWLDQGSPAHFTFAELGPGRGTLMADALRAADRVPGFTDAANIWLIETSPVLRARQAETLRGFDPNWITSVDALPAGPLFLIANEFFDALPIRQFMRGEGGYWNEQKVGEEDGKLYRGLSAPSLVPDLDHRLQDTEFGDIVETCPAAKTIMTEISARIAQHGGVALIIDYGDWRSLGDTVQAIQNGDLVDPFAAPGTADITAHVDFEALAMACPDVAHTKLTPQGVFLERLGITARAQTLAKSASGPAQEAVVTAHRRLTSPLEMGNLFKVLGVMPKGAMPPPGLEI